MEWRLECGRAFFFSELLYVNKMDLDIFFFSSLFMTSSPEVPRMSLAGISAFTFKVHPGRRNSAAGLIA